MEEIIRDSINNDISQNDKEIINIQNSTIKKLNEQLSIYKSQLKERREKIYSSDNIVINFNIIMINWIKLLFIRI